MNEPSEPPLLPLASQEAVSRRPGGVPKRALVIKSRKSNRLFQVNRLASDLVDCLGEFLASKNVINRSERYAKIGEEQTTEGGRVNPRITIDLRQHNSQSNCNYQVDQDRNKNKQIDNCPAQIKVKKFNQIGSKGQAARRKKRDVSQLLGDLLSGRCPESRLCLVGKLLRAPIVLAALFSLSLATSLFILYTLSFHHCQTAGHPDARSGSSTLRARAFIVASSSSQREVGRSELSLSNQHETGAEELIAAVPSLERPTTHHINNRHLVNVGNSSSDDKRTRQVFETECGTYEARPEGGAWVLTGIAYASPPVGPRRWQKPHPIWRDNALCPAGRPHSSLDARGPRRAQTIPNHCVQFSPFNNRVSGSEDCLHLDIYTPAVGGEKSDERLPVMVYIHGGFLAFGSSNGPPDVESVPSDQREDEDRANWMRARPSGQLASELNVVLVAPNYRLQALGFMALRALAEDNGPDGSEGNYGLWDQLLALEWIRRNIGSFGGDPDNVLLFGPDAASALPLALVSQKQQQQRPVRQPNGPADEKERRAAIDLSVGPDTANTADARRRLESQLPPPPQPLPFRSVWLMNPTIYYELPYELANQHYARLGWSQSACARAGRARDLQLQPPTPPRGLASERSLIACLMNLTGEQIVREYLGRDRPSFRLDDENSLPIRSIFPDQFVTLDGELVQDSYPFTRHLSADRLDNNRIEDKSQVRPVPGVNFLLGSTAQAVAYWPCPRNSHAWSWLDFRHYVETSLNSFNQPQASDTFKLASELYAIPNEGFTSSGGGNNNNDSSPSPSPMGTYLTMVSDIRQVCPGHELAKSLRQSARVESVERYVVEWRPSARLSASLGMTTNDPADVGGGKCPDCAPSVEMNREPKANQTNLQYAFHYWDLLALFGFEFDAQLEPSEQDLEFQRHIRAMAKRVAWQGQAGRPTPANKLVLNQFDVDETEHKRRECKMWRHSLKHSYAWVS